MGPWFQLPMVRLLFPFMSGIAVALFFYTGTDFIHKSPDRWVQYSQIFSYGLMALGLMAYLDYTLNRSYGLRWAGGVLVAVSFLLLGFQ